jgi:hypothetical protein
LDTEEKIRKTLYQRLSEFKKDISLFTYTSGDLKIIPTWHTLSMVRDGVFAYSTKEVEMLFCKILKKAEKAGLIIEERAGNRYFTLPNIKFGQIIEISLYEEFR